MAAETWPVSLPPRVYGCASGVGNTLSIEPTPGGCVQVRISTDGQQTFATVLIDPRTIPSVIADLLMARDA